MANPNIAGLTTVKGKTVGVVLSTTNETNLVTNFSNSGNVLKINSVVISNVDGTNSATIDVILNKTANASPAQTFYLAKSVTVPANSRYVVVTKNLQLYLEENNSIVLQASAANDLQAICSYEEIS
tara:strand:+ start:209 stop:586 length:378 start_codon:yes stop_codon:yes gene_type:complete